MPDVIENAAPVDTGQSSTAVLDAPAKSPKQTKPKPKELPPYKVLLHNDDVNSFEHVIVSILKVTNLTPQEALLRTLEAHETGVALLLTTHKERAELYQEQFLTFQITATIEPA
ncbi:MAG: ATP-dependent Clp protease adaptor ClpS [Planctomycetes bacterium]|nr:ATP-dependent Clp protease adaptor ClpS [Planctomycetota bacterium]MBI3834398.1 ATP-dependent Clp protease adaptor ClpS [Planctomycetota bacterium]